MSWYETSPQFDEIQIGSQNIIATVVEDSTVFEEPQESPKEYSRVKRSLDTVTTNVTSYLMDSHIRDIPIAMPPVDEVEVKRIKGGTLGSPEIKGLCQKSGGRASLSIEYSSRIYGKSLPRDVENVIAHEVLHMPLTCPAEPIVDLATIIANKQPEEYRTVYFDEVALVVSLWEKSQGDYLALEELVIDIYGSLLDPDLSIPACIDRARARVSKWLLTLSSDNHQLLEERIYELFNTSSTGPKFSQLSDIAILADAEKLFLAKVRFDSPTELTIPSTKTKIPRPDAKLRQTIKQMLDKILGWDNETGYGF